jgi:hypothetical protein
MDGAVGATAVGVIMATAAADISITADTAMDMAMAVIIADIAAYAVVPSAKEFT